MLVSKETFRRLREEASIELAFISRSSTHYDRAKNASDKIEEIWRVVYERNCGTSDQLVVMHDNLQVLRQINEP